MAAQTQYRDVLAGHKRIVACANLYASLDEGSTDGVLSKQRLATVAKVHSGRKVLIQPNPICSSAHRILALTRLHARQAERWVGDVFWRSVDRQGAAAGIALPLTLEELLDGLIDLTEEDQEKFRKLVLCHYVDISEGGHPLSLPACLPACLPA